MPQVKGLIGLGEGGVWCHDVGSLSLTPCEAPSGWSAHRQLGLVVGHPARSPVPPPVGGAAGPAVVVSGFGTDAIGLGTRLRVGEALVAVSELPRGPAEGEAATFFATVEDGGNVRVGDAVAWVDVVGPERIQAVVLTVSDRCARGEAKDTAGPAVAERLAKGLDAHVFRTEVVPDERSRIAERLEHFADVQAVDLVVAVGGTGFAPRDITPEATRSVIERPTPGLDEAMRRASMEKTPFGMLSRGISGIRGGTLIVNLPGSERAAVENIDAILRVLPHGLAKLRGDTADCGTGTRPAHVRLGSGAG